jgi:hypothetical protein
MIQITRRPPTSRGRHPGAPEGLVFTYSSVSPTPSAIRQATILRQKLQQAFAHVRIPSCLTDAEAFRPGGQGGVGHRHAGRVILDLQIQMIFGCSTPSGPSENAGRNPIQYADQPVAVLWRLQTPGDLDGALPGEAATGTPPQRRSPQRNVNEIRDVRNTNHAPATT